QLLGRRLRIGDHRAAAHSVHQDVDATMIARHFRHHGIDLRRIKGIDQLAFDLPPDLPAALRKAGTASSRWLWLLSTAITVAPSRTMIRAVARPMPFAPAVI